MDEAHVFENSILLHEKDGSQSFFGLFEVWGLGRGRHGDSRTPSGEKRSLTHALPPRLLARSGLFGCVILSPGFMISRDHTM